MEFPFDNSFLVIILIAVIASFFKKKKGRAGDSKTQKRINNPSEGRKNKWGSPFKDVREILQEVTRSLQEDTGTRKKAGPVYHKKQERMAQAIEKSVSEKEVPYMSKPQPSASEKPQNKEIIVDEGRLADAVIWSEILGPPRARNPYWKKKNRY